MKRQRNRQQVDLFDAPKSLEIKERVRDLDRQISSALKKNEYDKAKEMTKEQEDLIQELVKMGEAQKGGPSENEE